MKHDRFRGLLSDFAEETLSEADRGEFLQHLAECPRCAPLAASFATTLRALRSFPRLEVPPGFTARVLERTTRRRPVDLFAERFLIGLRFPGLSPTFAAAAVAMLLLLLAGTQAGRQAAREFSMATHQTYSNALRLYSRSGDLRESAVAVGRRIPSRLEGTVEWFRDRLGSEADERRPPPRSKDRNRRISRSLGSTRSA